MYEEQVMELLWQNGQVVMHGPNKLRTAVNSGGARGSSTLDVAEDAPQLFIQEDEMSSWLHYPLPLDDEPQFDRDFCSDLLFPPLSSSAAGSCTDKAVTDPVHSIRYRDRLPPPPVSLTRRADDGYQPQQGFGHFSGFRPRQEPPAGFEAPKGINSNHSTAETIVESNPTPAIEVVKTGFVAASSSVGCDGVAETASLDFTFESYSSGASGAEPVLPSVRSDKKRKAREVEELDYHSQDVVIKAAETKKQVHGSMAKRIRATEVHNLSERRRRDRINEKMKALQELIPRCNKSDKASMLDDAIEYLKSLQLQVQLISMGCGMVPMMFLGMQQYLQLLGMGMGMGMGVDVNRPMMPFPMAAPTNMGPGFPVPSYQPIPCVVSPDSSRIQVNNQGSLLNPAGTQNVYQQSVQTIPDQYQQYLGSQTMQQMQAPQNDATSLPVTCKPIHSGGPENLEPPHLPLPG